MIDGYIGIPYVDKGRKLDGADCWGLVRIVHMQEAGIEIPSYGDISEKDLLRVVREMKAGLESDIWVDVADRPRAAMDVVVMTKLDEVASFPYHVGIMMSPTRMLHTVRAAASHMSRLSDPTIKIIGFRRHKDLA